MYQKVDLRGPFLVGAPGPLPNNLLGLSDASLSDIGAANEAAGPGLKGYGWWPVVTLGPVYDPTAQVPDGTVAWKADVASRRVVGTPGVRALTAEEAAALNPVPQSVTGTQGQIALLLAGKLDPALAAIDGIKDATQKRIAQIKFNAATWLRADATLNGLGHAIGLSDADMDALFRSAAAQG